MANQSCGCWTEAALYGFTTDCGCPSERPHPFSKFNKLCVGDIDFEESFEEIESENTRGQEVCSFTVNNGASFGTQTDLDFGSREPFWQGAMGAIERPLPDATGTFATTENTLCSTDVDFDKAGFKVGMVVALEGFADIANNSDPATSGREYPAYYTIDAISLDDATGESCLTLCTGGHQDKWIPDLVDGDTGTRVYALKRVWETSNQSAYASFQKVIIGPNGENVFQGIYGALLSSTSLTFTPNGLSTADFEAGPGDFVSPQVDFLGLPKERDLCETCCDTVKWDATKGQVQLHVACNPICVTSFSLSINRNPNTETTSCGIKTSAGRYELTGTVEALFGEGAYATQFMEFLSDNTVFPVHIRYWDSEFKRMGYISIPASKLTAAPISTPDGECAKMTLEFKAQSSCGGALAYGGATYDRVTCVENAVCYSTNATSTDVVITGALGNTFHIVNSEDSYTTPDYTATGSQSHSYTDNVMNHAGWDYDVEDVPWTEYVRKDSGLTSVDICRLKAATNIDVSGNDLSFVDAGQMTALAMLDVSNNPNMTGLEVYGSFLLTTINAVGTQLSSTTIEKLFSDLILHGQQGGQVDLDPSTIYTATALNLRDELVNNAGWTITP